MKKSTDFIPKFEEVFSQMNSRLPYSEYEKVKSFINKNLDLQDNYCRMVKVDEPNKSVIDIIKKDKLLFINAFSSLPLDKINEVFSRFLRIGEFVTNEDFNFIFENFINVLNLDLVPNYYRDIISDKDRNISTVYDLFKRSEKIIADYIVNSNYIYKANCILMSYDLVCSLENKK